MANESLCCILLFEVVAHGWMDANLLLFSRQCREKKEKKKWNHVRLLPNKKAFTHARAQQCHACVFPPFLLTHSRRSVSQSVQWMETQFVMCWSESIITKQEVILFLLQKSKNPPLSRKQWIGWKKNETNTIVSLQTQGTANVDQKLFWGACDTRSLTARKQTNKQPNNVILAAGLLFAAAGILSATHFCNKGQFCPADRWISCLR